MENSYGVGIHNRYALFLSEEDPFEKLKAKEKEKEARKKKSQAEKENKGVKSVVTKEKSTKSNGIKDTQNSQNLKTSAEIKPKDDSAKLQQQQQQKKEIKVKFSDDKKPQPDIFKDNETDNNYFVSRKENNYTEDKEKRFNNESRGYRGDRDREPRGERGDDNDRFGRGGSRPPRGGRGNGRGGRGGDFRGKREFDRQSGSDKTGIKSSSKRNGGGAHNWGSDRDEIDEQISGVTTTNLDTSSDWGVTEVPNAVNDSVTDDASAANGGEKKDTSTPPGDAVEAMETAEAKEITLDEWKASRGSKLLKPQYNLRKAGEGEDLTQWKNMYELKKKKEAEAAAEQEKQAAAVAATEPAKAYKKKEIVDTNFHFADQAVRGGRGNRRGGPRGGRGGERGDRFRDGPREKGNYSRGNRNTPRVDVTNEHDFPSLG